MKIVLFLLFVIACVVGQAQNPGDVELLIIDDFSLGQNDNGVRVLTSQTIVEGQDPPVSATDSFNGGSTCSGLVACIRDLSIEVTNSFAGRSFTANIYAPVNNFDGEFSISTSKGGHSTTIAQYDGVFGFTSPPSNFMMVDLTVGNSNPYFFLSVFTDLQSSVFIDVRDTQAQLCTHEISVSAITGGYQIEETYYYVDFQAASFSSCDMTQISSIELRMPYTDSVDAIIKRFSVYGPVPPTNSLSATPTRTFTPSRTPTQSITSTPSRSPTPSTSPSFLSVPSLSPILSASPTPSTSPVSASPSTSPIRLPSASRTPAASPSSSITPTASVSKSRGATPSRTPSASPICVNCARESRVIDTVEEPVAVAVGATEVVAPPGSLQVGETLIVTDAGNSQSQNVPLPPGEISGDVVIIDLVDESGNEAQPSGPIDICITPEPNPPDDLCLAFQSNGAWLCEDDSPVLTNGQYCGVSNHFTIFALVSKRSIPDPIGPAPGDRSSFSSVRDSSTTYAFPTSFFNTFQTNAFTSAFTSSPSDSSDGVSMISFLSVGVVTLFLVALC